MKSNEELKPDTPTEKENIKIDTFRLFIGGLIGIISFAGKWPLNLNIILIITSYIILIYDTFIEAIRNLTHKKINEKLLVTLSTIGAFFLGQIYEGLMVIFLHELGELLENIALARSRKSISDLMNIKEEVANLKDGSTLRKVSAKSVEIGDIIVVRQGEKVPLDGIVVSGSSYLDTSSLTGESRLVKTQKGDQVASGVLNKDKIIEIRVTAKYKDSTVSKILNLLSEATSRKSKTETFVSKYASVYTYIVLLAAIITSISFPLLTDLSIKESIYKGLTVLLIACPCAIVISVPLSYFTAIGASSRKGILIKGSNYLDGLKNIKEIVFDKTGTITTGNFYVSKINIHDSKYSEDKVLEIFAKGESLSSHPIAKSIVSIYSKKIKMDDIEDFKEVVGEGITFKYQNQKVKIGSAKLCSVAKSQDDIQKIYLTISGKLVASLEIRDEIKANAKEVISTLAAMNINTHLYTGDVKDKALALSQELNIKSVHYEMLPTDKYAEMTKLINQKEPDTVVSFVGDGINDAPVIALSDIGISMGALGTDSAIEASDVVIMNDNLESIITAINISQRTNRIIKQNLIFALLIKVVVLILSLVGITTMWEAVFSDVGVTLLCIFNTLRIMKQKN